jgi:hypothetical protein
VLDGLRGDERGLCASGIRPGAVVEVAVSRHNRRRVTIDVGQGGGARGRAQSDGTQLTGRMQLG